MAFAACLNEEEYTINACNLPEHGFASALNHVVGDDSSMHFWLLIAILVVGILAVFLLIAVLLFVAGARTGAASRKSRADDFAMH